jgi:hypothetical protein
LNSRLESYKVNIEQTEAKITSGFPDSDKIAQLTARLQDISAIMAEYEAIITTDKPRLDSDSEEEEEAGTYLGDDLSIGETVCSAEEVEILQSRIGEIPDWLKDIRAVISEFYVSKSEVTIEEASLVVETESAVVEVAQVKDEWKPIPLPSWGNSKEEGDKPVKHRSKSKAKSSESAYTQLSLFDVA